MAAGAPMAVGERSVSVGGDVVGSIIVTGDNNNFKLVLSEQQGALLEQLTRGSRPSKRLRSQPLGPVPPPFADTVDRATEVTAIRDALSVRASINVYGPAGIGKTHAVLKAMDENAEEAGRDAVYLFAPGPLDDVLQQMFEAWFECDPPFKPSRSQLRSDLSRVNAVAVLDSVELERDAAQQVVLTAAGCRLIVASRERVMFDGRALYVDGLAPEHAVKLVELELGRPLLDSEQADAARICTALGGHPLKVREAVATLGSRRSLSELASQLSAGDGRAALAERKRAAAGADGRRLAATLSLFGGATVGEEHLRAIAGLENFDTVLSESLARRDLRSHSPRYTLAVSLRNTDVPPDELTVLGTRALAHFTGWARENRAAPALLITESAALLSLMRWAVSTGRLDSAIELGRAIDHAFPLERRFGAWGAELDLVHAAALAAGDHRSEAWALHQLGTRAICLGELALGVALLEQARELHGELGDAQGAACSAHNLRLATRPRWFWHWIAGHSLLMAVVASLVVAGVVAAAVLPGGKAPPAQSSAASPATSTPAEVATSSTISAPSSTSTSTSQPSPTPASGNNPNPGGAPPTTTTTNPPVTLTIEVPNGGTVRSKPGLIDCPDTCSEGFPVGTPLTLVASGPAFWSGAPGCPPPPPTSVIARIQGSSSPQTSASSAGAPTDSTTSAATSNTAPSSTCPITLERSTTVSVLVLPG